jgi:hypothetical protein
MGTTSALAEDADGLLNDDDLWVNGKEVTRFRLPGSFASLR